jgi:hypothetical protein
VGNKLKNYKKNLYDEKQKILNEMGFFPRLKKIVESVESVESVEYVESTK